MIRCVLTSIYYPMAILRYFEAALRRRPDVELFTVGPFTGPAIPWNGGMTLPQKYAIAPDLPLGNIVQGNVPINYIETLLPWSPDLWLQVDAGFFLSGRPKSGLNAFVGTDPHVLDYSLQRALADKFFCMQAYYAQGRDEYLPYAYDPLWHAPEKQPRRYDVVLLGLHYENRNRLVSELKRQGVNVFYELGPVFDEARAIYNSAPLGLNWSSLNDLTARVFELLGMGRLAVVNRVPDLGQFFEDGRDLAAFDSLGEAVEKVLHYLAHPEQAAAIAHQGKKTVAPHTWDDRVEQIFKTCKLV